MWFTYGFFLVCMTLDFTATDFGAAGNIHAEGNSFAAFWWTLTGPLHHIDIPIWIVFVFCISYLIIRKSEFFALWWVNGLAFSHLMGFLSWLPYGILDPLYIHVKSGWNISVVISCIGVLLGFPLAFMQTKNLSPKKKADQ